IAESGKAAAAPATEPADTIEEIIMNRFAPTVGSFLLGHALSPVENLIGTSKMLVAARLAYRRLAQLFRIAPPREPGMELPEPVGDLSIEALSYPPPGAEKPTLRG